MEIRVLEYFLAVAREQSITGAAESLHLTQPTLSRQLRELENELGKQLLIRGNRKVTLTDEGMLLRKRAQEIIDLVQKTENEVILADDVISGDLYIGAGETDGVRYLARAAEELQSLYPDVHFHITSGDGVDVREGLEKGLLDFGLLIGEIDRAKYNMLEVPVKDKWGILMRRDSPLAQKEFVTPEDIDDKPLIVSRQVFCRGGLADWFSRDYEELNIVATYNLVYNASLMVLEGMGYTLTLDRLINTAGSSLIFVPLEPAREVGMAIVWKKYQVVTKAAAKYLEFLTREINNEKNN